MLCMLGATEVAPKADLDDGASPPGRELVAAFPMGTVRVLDCCGGLVGELTGVAPMIINEVSISRPGLAGPPGDSDDEEVSVVPFGFWD